MAILATIASDRSHDGYTHVLPLLDRLVTLVDDMWPVQAQLTLLASSLLLSLPLDQAAVITRVEDAILRRLLLPSSSPLVLRAGILPFPFVMARDDLTMVMRVNDNRLGSVVSVIRCSSCTSSIIHAIIIRPTRYDLVCMTAASQTARQPCIYSRVLQ